MESDLERHCSFLNYTVVSVVAHLLNERTNLNDIQILTNPLSHEPHWKEALQSPGSIKLPCTVFHTANQTGENQVTIFQISPPNITSNIYQIDVTSKDDIFYYTIIQLEIMHSDITLYTCSRKSYNTCDGGNAITVCQTGATSVSTCKIITKKRREKIYCFGGYSQTLQSLNSLVKISLQWSPKDKPSSLLTLHMKSVCNAPQPRGGHSLTAISYGLFLCGGACGSTTHISRWHSNVNQPTISWTTLDRSTTITRIKNSNALHSTQQNKQEKTKSQYFKFHLPK